MNMQDAIARYKPFALAGYGTFEEMKEWAALSLTNSWLHQAEDLPRDGAPPGAAAGDDEARLGVRLGARLPGTGAVLLRITRLALGRPITYAGAVVGMASAEAFVEAAMRLAGVDLCSGEFEDLLDCLERRIPSPEPRAAAGVLAEFADPEFEPPALAIASLSAVMEGREEDPFRLLEYFASCGAPVSSLEDVRLKWADSDDDEIGIHQVLEGELISIGSANSWALLTP